MQNQKKEVQRGVLLKAPQFLPVQFYLASEKDIWGAGALTQWKQLNAGGSGATATLSFTIASGRIGYQPKGLTDLTGTEVIVEVSVPLLTPADPHKDPPAFVTIQVDRRSPPLTFEQNSIISALIADAFELEKSLFAAAFGTSV
ncbi:hypothetical protein [uncultured Roseobacter sp.]|uniref:hypothetical protein n=1 Tax=uncultured Roseobacter sp. TaxID=114847 RepID=UPI00261D5962|nr:hypothetical protein [uncultured Roseobacter sp.]